MNDTTQYLSSYTTIKQSTWFGVIRVTVIHLFHCSCRVCFPTKKMSYLFQIVPNISRYWFVHVKWVISIILLELPPWDLPHIKKRNIYSTKAAISPVHPFTCAKCLMAWTIWFGLLITIVRYCKPSRPKQKMIKRDSVPYMNSKLRKHLYLRNKARNKYKKCGKHYWDANRRMRNKIVALRKKSNWKRHSEMMCRTSL